MPAAGERHVRDGVRNGVIRRLVTGKGFGWIEDDRKDDDVKKLLYFEIRDAKFSPVAVNTRVCYQLYTDLKGIGACELQLPRKDELEKLEPEPASTVGAWLDVDPGVSAGSPHGDVVTPATARESVASATPGDCRGNGGLAAPAAPLPPAAITLASATGKRLSRTLLDDGQSWYGTVEVWDPKKRIGWIVSDDKVDAKSVPAAKLNSGKVFVGASDVLSARSLLPGTRVCFKLYSDSKGLGAREVQVVEPRGGLRLAPRAADAGLAYVSNPGHVPLRVRVPKDFVGGLIGKNGASIKQAQSESKTDWSFDEWNGPEVRDDFLPMAFQADWRTKTRKYSILTIVGEPTAVTAGAEMVGQKIRDLSMSHLRMLQLLVPDRLLGRVIGKKGENVKKLQGNWSNQIVIGDSVTLGVGATQEQVAVVTICGADAGAFQAALKILIDILAKDCLMAFTRSREPFRSSWDWEWIPESLGKGGKYGPWLW